MKKIKYLLMVAIFLVPGAVSLSQSVPSLVNYQGRLTDSAGLPLMDGTSVDLTFGFYGVESGSTPLYLAVFQEDVVVSQGIYHVLIGSGTITPGLENSLADVFQKHPEVWMGVKVDAESEMTPRARISSVPYSLAVDLSSFYAGAAANPDFDGDGYVTALLGGPDCNDGDSTVNPDGQDLSKDGIDQNCNGRDGEGKIYLFSSVSVYDGNILGTLGGYGICNADKVNYPEIPGDNVRAFLSDHSADTISQMPANYGVPVNLPIVGPTGIKIADNWADLLDGSIDTSLQAAGVAIGVYWTGSTSGGLLSPWNCIGFTELMATGTAGSNTDTDYRWLEAGDLNCDDLAFLLCVAW